MSLAGFVDGGQAVGETFMLIDPREVMQTQVCSRKAGLPIEAFGEGPTAGPVAVYG